MKVYLVSETTFYNDNGIDRQIGNYGELPTIYTAKYKAEKDFLERIKEYGGKWRNCQMFPFTSWERKYKIGNIEYRKIYSLQETETY